MADKKLIICIEDEPETTNLMKLILAREGYEVLGANGGEEGLALVNEKSTLCSGGRLLKWMTTSPNPSGRRSWRNGSSMSWPNLVNKRGYLLTGYRSP
jgi:CheY-like chemotaxis protein